LTRAVARPVFPGVTIIDLPWVNAWLLHNERDAMIIDSGTSRDRALESLRPEPLAPLQALRRQVLADSLGLR